MDKSAKKELGAPQFLMILHGPSCGGKSATAKYLTDNYQGVFHATRDRIKWMISGYNSEKHHALTAKMIFALIEIALQNGLSIVQDQGIVEDLTEQYQQLVKKYKVQFIEANIEASFSTISKRFEERIEAAKYGAQVSLKDPVVMKEKYDSYLVNKNKDLITMMTDNKSPKDVARELLDLVNKP